MEEHKFAPENPDEDQKIIDALTHDKLDEVEWVPSKTAEEIKELRDAVVDRRSLEILGRIKPNKDASSETSKKVEMSDKKREMIKKIEELDEKARKGGLTTEDYMDLITRVNEDRDDPSNEIYSNVEKGSVFEILYRTLAEMHPELGITITDDAEDMLGKPVPHCFTIRVVPYKTDKNIISKIISNPIMSVLTMSGYSLSYREGIELEKQGVLPPGTSIKALVRAYIDLVNLTQSTGGDAELLQEKVKLMKADPLSDQELKAIFEKMINESYEE